jgi:hypothetical protein
MPIHVNRENFDVILKMFILFNIWQRLSVAAVRDCGRQNCPPTPKFERGRMFE